MQDKILLIKKLIPGVEYTIKDMLRLTSKSYVTGVYIIKDWRDHGVIAGKYKKHITKYSLTPKGTMIQNKLFELTKLLEE